MNSNSKWTQNETFKPLAIILCFWFSLKRENSFYDHGYVLLNDKEIIVAGAVAVLCGGGEGMLIADIQAKYWIDN